MITSASPARRAIVSSSSVRSWIGGTGLGGNSRGNPVMGHSPKAGQAPDQANEGGQAGAGSTGDKSRAGHAHRRSACKRVTQYHQAPTLANPSPSSRNRHTKTHSLQNRRRLSDVVVHLGLLP